MPIEIVRNDITKMKVSAIVNAANNSILGGGGVDGAIHRAAGSGLLEECKTKGGCKTGDAKITGGYNLQAKYVIHTVGPRYRGGSFGEKELLESCYRKSLSLALEYKCESIAFPLISSGAYGYPKDKALKVALDTISEFLLENEMQVYIVIFDKASLLISEKLFSDISEYIDDNYVDKHYQRRTRQQDNDIDKHDYYLSNTVRESIAKDTCQADEIVYNKLCSSLSDMLNELDESFSQMLLRKIDEKGMTDIECYKKANVDRKLFSKIRSDINYKPSKPTAIALAISLQLSLEETKDLLKKAGFALSHSNKFDIIIEYCITNKIYNIHEVNEVLFSFDQSLLGA